MISKSEWEVVNRQFMEDERRRLGDPPTAEQLLDYRRGALGPEEEARVRQWLACDPELARMMAEPFPAEGAERGDPDFLPDAVLDEHWAAMQKRLGRAGRRGRAASTRVVQFWRASAAIAAAVAVCLGVLLWQAASAGRRPDVWEEQVLLPDGRRGPESELPILTATGETVVLITPLIGEHDFERYRLQIIDLDTNRPIWSSAAPHPREDNSFTIVVPRRFLTPGAYRIAVYGVAGGGEERLATYSLRVPR